ncbi:sensor histidine kinase [Aeromonas hydrophila]|uniref:sensor histidine kinase n=1 Tax=Aeromonas hydrophila TaxID=644 RepID=UPI001A8CA68A|nr:cache domain-containing protein [Aeromonas hydrophila]MBQ4665822.1 HAMP domain-containing protein [Aeromonas hydrophila]MBQ4715815.1 HAMP domain-containing protein [Aeromonas hydrophila]MBW3824231.1 two-component sensor histidine kinase [Aeromonas hydrophila]MBW5267538.1 two-component sensor histidine kinase [Aeromonas hydrophila]QSR50919.1 two-component sensor histidine kinase [Aeromonas hydrophila]
MRLAQIPWLLRTKVRWRLLLLTSVPIMLTLAGMIGLTLYWTLTYSWQNLLTTVRSDLGVAHHAVSVQQQRQAEHLEHLRDAWAFQLQLRESPARLRQWVMPLAANYGLDFLRLRSGSELDLLPAQDRAALAAGRSISHFVVWSREQLLALSPALASRAVLEREYDPVAGQETRGLVSLSLTPVMGRDGSLWGVLEGGELINGSTRLVDELKGQVFAKNTLPAGSIGTVTLFLGDLRVSTNVPASSSRQLGRAVGTRVSAPVREQVLGRGEPWIDRAFVHDAWYVSGYEPLLGANGERIGMLYVGFLEWPIIRTYLTNLLELGSGVVVLLLLSGLLVYRGARDLFTPIERMHKVVRQVQAGQPARIGVLALDPDHELAQLGRQFDAMLDQQAAHQQQLARSADELEQKVAERTQSLEQKTAELEHHIHMLTQARQQLLISEKLAALGELCAGVAHEINNPLAVILGNVELMKLELGEAAAPVSEELALVLAQIERIRAITRSLLQYSRPGDYETAPVWQHLTPIIEESLTLVRSALRQQQVNLVADLRAQQPIEADRQQLLQVLINLLVNASHALGEQGEIRVESHDWLDDAGALQGAEVRVIDNGSGIEAAIIDKIFDPFFTTRATGTGLGLALSHRIISRWGGELLVDSTPGQGSCFTIRLRSHARLASGGERARLEGWRIALNAEGREAGGDHLS